MGSDENELIMVLKHPEVVFQMFLMTALPLHLVHNRFQNFPILRPVVLLFLEAVTEDEVRALLISLKHGGAVMSMEGKNG